MDTDGHLDGYDIPLTRAISEAVEVPVIASGGCGNPQHMVRRHRRGQGRRRAGRQHLPLRHLQHPRDQGVPGRARHPRAALRGAADDRCAREGIFWDMIAGRRPLPAVLGLLGWHVARSRAGPRPRQVSGQAGVLQPRRACPGRHPRRHARRRHGRRRRVAARSRTRRITTLDMKMSYMQSVRDVPLVAEGASCTGRLGGLHGGHPHRRRRLAGGHRHGDGARRAHAASRRRGGLSMVDFDKGRRPHPRRHPGRRHGRGADARPT